MAETSSAAFNCAAKSWNASQPSPSSALSELLTELQSSNANKSALANNKQQPIKNGNGVDESRQHLNAASNRPASEKHLNLKRKLSSSASLSPTKLGQAPVHLRPTKLNDDQLTGQQQSPIFGTVNENANHHSPARHATNSPTSQLNDRPPVSVTAAAVSFNQNESSEEQPPNTAESAEFVRGDHLRFAIGFKLEACDATGTWYPAKVVAINEKENQVLIHFIRWSKKFDEWMAMDSDSLRALTNESGHDDENGESDPQKSFTTGKLVLATWSDTKKYPGTIQGITSDGNYNILFLDGYRKKVKKSLVEQLPADYQLNFSSPIDNLAVAPATLDGQQAAMKAGLDANHALQQTNGTAGASSATPPLNAGSIQRNSLGKKRSTDHLVATKEFVVTADHNQFKCEVENCNKSFRKESLLNSHIKYYHRELYNSEEYRKRRLEESTSYLDDSQSNDQSINSTSRRAPVNENSNTSWNSEAATPKAKSSSKKSKEPSDKSAASKSNKSTNSIDQQQPVTSDTAQQPLTPLQQQQPSQLANGELETLTDPVKSSATDHKPATHPKPAAQKKRSRASLKQQQQQQLAATNDLSKSSSPNLSTAITSTAVPASSSITPAPPPTPSTPKPSRLSNQNDSSVNYASDSTIEDSISSFDSPLVINNGGDSKPKPAKRGRGPGKRKIKEKVDPDYLEDSMTSSNVTPVSASKSASKRKYRSKAKNCLNKELLEMKMDLQEKQRLNVDGDQPNLFFTNTPSTSSASESALAESAEFGEFHNYDEKRYRDTSPFSLDEFARSPTNSSLYVSDSGELSKKKKKSPKKSSASSFNSPSSTNKRPRLVGQVEHQRNMSSPTFLSTPTVLTGGYSTPSRKSFAFRDGFIFAAAQEANSSNLSPLSLHALEKPVPNTLLPFWDARYVRSIHESDDVDELVHCICDFKEESGLMIQCEICLTWSHGSCFDIETEDKVPDSYVCFACKNPKAVRQSLRYSYDQEWLRKGKNPIFQFIGGKKSSPEAESIVQSQDSIKQMMATNQILSILIDTSQVLRSLRHKINLIKANNVKEMKFWEAHLEAELPPAQPPPAASTEELLANEDELEKNKIILDQNITQTEHDMIGDILNFSKNILMDNVATDADSRSIDDDINNELDDATDLIDFITSSGKEEEEEEHAKSNHLDFNSGTNNSKSPFAIDTKTEPLDDKSLLPDLNNFILDAQVGNSNALDAKLTATVVAAEPLHSDLPSIDEQLADEKPKSSAPKTLEEKLLEHINSVQMNCMKNLELAEKKISELEKESGEITNGLKADLTQFKDLVKNVYQDLQNVSRFTMT